MYTKDYKGKFDKLKDEKKSNKNAQNIIESEIISELRRTKSDSNVHFYVDTETEKERVMNKEEYFYKHHLPSFNCSMPNSPIKNENNYKNDENDNNDLSFPKIRTLNRSLSLSSNQYEISLSKDQKEKLEMISMDSNLLIRKIKLQMIDEDENIITVEKLEDRNYSYPKSIFHKEEVEKSKKIVNRKASLSYFSKYSVYEKEIKQYLDEEELERENEYEKENSKKKNFASFNPEPSTSTSIPDKKKVLQESKIHNYQESDVSADALVNFDNILHCDNKENKDAHEDDGKDLIEIKGKNSLIRKVMMKFKAFEVMVNNKKKSTSLKKQNSKPIDFEEDKENFSSF